MSEKEAENIFDGTWSCRNEDYNKQLIKAAEDGRNVYYNTLSTAFPSIKIPINRGFGRFTQDKLLNFQVSCG